MQDIAKITKLLDAYQTGITDHDLPLSTLDEVRIVSIHMANQAYQHINIVSRNLDRLIYSSTEFCQAVFTLAKNNKNASIRILTHDTNEAIKQGHNIIDLYQRIDSFITIKMIHENFAQYNKAWMSIDNKGLVYREFADRYDGIANYHHAQKCLLLTKEFEEIWKISSTNSQLRRLTI